ncbi:hypothetical protein [Phyllobacterium bourgognense]|uniref:Uncharacterized protein n=1 Tax=Phyllobacterium bourgognense TaxID=314236 RepID=A0A368YKY7_9HYPH|nr:hypothetical protein [Phyllobacterium bourgognense]RCW80901.1 hypothetical protein C7476_11257 [Phyllobacterium bourgognense]
MDPSGLKIPYPDLINAIIPASGTKPIGIDNATFQAAISKYNIFYAAGSENTNGNDAAYYTFKGAFLVGPTDFGGNSGLSNVPLAVLLPSCDGDMANLQGASTYDRNRFGRTGDVAPRYQVMVNGANHNDYNTIWTNEDFTFNTEAKTWRGPQHCNRDVKQKDNIRLSREDQRRTGLFVINSFMRYHVGDEKKFQSWWSGAAQLPNETCPSGKGPCDERIVLTVQRAANDRLRIQNFEWADSLRLNLIGGAVSFSGFDEKAKCILPSVADVGGNCTLKRLSGFEYSGWGGKGLLSIADHVELAWSKPKEEAGKQPVQAERAIISDLKDLSAKDYDSLTFRIAVVRPMGQEVLVTLTDTAGKSATVTASNFTNALYNAPRRKTYPVKTVPVANASIGLPDPAKANSTMVDLIGQQAPFESPPAVTLVAPPEPDPARDIPLLDHTADAPYANGEVKMLLNMVAIPLQAFEGIDLAHLDKLKLAFPKESGKVAITDIELQNFGRAERLAEIALEQAGIVSGSGAGIALNGNGGPPKSASGKPEDKQLILNH